MRLSNAFYSLVPHISWSEGGGTRARLPPIDNARLLQQKREMLETLGNIELATKALGSTAGAGAGSSHHLPAYR